MKKLILFLIIFFVFWDSPLVNADEVIDQKECSSLYEITWETDVKINTSNEYQVKSLSGQIISWVEYKILRNWKLIDTINKDIIIRAFSEPWEILIEANIWGTWCLNPIISKNVKIYARTLLYIWDEKSWLDEAFWRRLTAQWILLKKIIIPSDKQDELSLLELLYKNSDLLTESNDVVISTLDPVWLFTLFAQKLSQNFIWKDKWFYIVSENSWRLISVLLWSASYKMGIDSFKLLKEENIPYFFLNYSKIFNSSAKNIPNIFTEINFKSAGGFSGLSFLTNSAIYSGFSLSFLWILLILAVLMFWMNMLKHIIGIQVFWSYDPLFFSICILIIWFIPTLFFFILAFFSSLLTKFIVSRIYLPIIARRSIFILLFIIMIFIWAGAWFESIKNIILSATSVWLLSLFPIILITIIVEKHFTDYDSTESFYSQITSLIIFIILWIIWWLILGSITFRNLLLAYPEILIVIFFINILIGRYSWLQITEYIRFLPLIKKLKKDDVEE